MSLIYNQYFKYFVLFFAIVLTSCAQTPVNQETPAEIPSLITVENTSTEPAKTPTSVLIPTWTPITKLSEEDAFVRLLAIYENNDGCDLPCWWNITPGSSLWSTVNDKLSPLGTIVLSDKADGRVIYTFIYQVPRKIDDLPDQLSSSFIVEEDKVQAISVGSRWVARDFDYSLAGLLEHLGKPTDIWLRLFPESVDGIPHYDMQIFFLDKGVWVWLNGDATIKNETMTICPADPIGNPTPRGLFMWNLEKAKSSIDMQKTFKFFWADGLKLDHYKLLQDVQSDIDNEGFYENYLDPLSTKCFSVNAKDFYNP